MVALRQGPSRSCGVVVLAALGGAGCGAGPATVHPAHALPEGAVVIGAGVSGNFATGDLQRKVDRARSLTPQTVTPDAEQAFVDGAIAHALVGPGVGPWAGGRVGLGYDTEGELTYAGRSVRAGARHAFETDRWALSAGAGASAVLLRPGSHPPDPSPMATTARFEDRFDETTVTGWGLDAPVVGGYRTEGEILQAWAGVRGGFESVAGHLALVPGAPGSPPTSERATVSGMRWYAGGLVGVAAGFDPIWVGVQLDAAYQSVTGRVETDDAIDPLDLHVRTDGVTVTPTGVLWGKF
jgi:hypothetical protein